MRIVLIAGDKRMDDLAHSFDVFEESKRFATIQTFNIEGEIPPDKRATVIEKFRQASKEFGKTVVACFSPGIPDGAFVLTGTKSISNGQKWTTLYKVLEAYGYAGEPIE